MATSLPTMTAAPTPPQPGQSRSPFTSNAYAFILWLATTFITELNAIIAKINQLGPDAALATSKAAEAAASAAAAEDAAGNNVRGVAPEQAPANRMLGLCAYVDKTWLYPPPIAWDAPSCASGAQVSTTMAAPGAEIGDDVDVRASIALSGLNLRGEVTATGVVTIYLSNLTGSAVDLASCTIYAKIEKRIPRR